MKKSFRSACSYEFIESLGTGGSAHVGLYLRSLEGVPPQEVVIKILKDTSETSLQEAINEWRVLDCLNHPHILSIYGLERIGNKKIGLILEYVKGTDLFNVNQQLSLVDRQEAANYIAFVLTSVLDAVHERGLVHGDLSLRNILVSEQGIIKVSDFGMSREKGSWDYLAPERWSRSKVSAQADVFSLGIIIYEILTGVNPIREMKDLKYPHRVQSFLQLKTWRHMADWGDFFEACFQEDPFKRASAGELKGLLPSDSSSTDFLIPAVSKAYENKIKGSKSLPLTTFITENLKPWRPQKHNFSKIGLPLCTLLSLLLLTPRLTGEHISRATCTLSIVSSPWAKVWLDQKPAGFTPLYRVKLPCGVYELSWQRFKGHKHTRTVRLYATRPTFVHIQADTPSLARQ